MGRTASFPINIVVEMIKKIINDMESISTQLFNQFEGKVEHKLEVIFIVFRIL